MQQWQGTALHLECAQVLEYLERNIKSSPAALADVHNEHPDELEERHERVVAASLKAWDSLLDGLLPAEPSEAPGSTHWRF